MARIPAAGTVAVVRTRAHRVVGSAFENPALVVTFLLVGVLIFWAVEDNVYGVVSSLASIVVSAFVTVRSARRR